MFTCKYCARKAREPSHRSAGALSVPFALFQRSYTLYSLPRACAWNFGLSVKLHVSMEISGRARLHANARKSVLRVAALDVRGARDDSHKHPPPSNLEVLNCHHRSSLPQRSPCPCLKLQYECTSTRHPSVVQRGGLPMRRVGSMRRRKSSYRAYGRNTP